LSWEQVAFDRNGAGSGDDTGRGYEKDYDDSEKQVEQHGGTFNDGSV